MKRDDKFTIELTAAELLKVYVVMGKANGRDTGSSAYFTLNGLLGVNCDLFTEHRDKLPKIEYLGIQAELEEEFFDKEVTIPMEDINDLLDQLECILGTLKQLNRGM